MGYTLNDNLIDVKNGITVKNINDDVKKYLWIEGYLRMNDLGILKTYKIYIATDHSLYPIIIRPREKYLCANFEALFQFKCKCSDYDENKMIGVTTHSPRLPVPPPCPRNK